MTLNVGYGMAKTPVKTIIVENWFLLDAAVIAAVRASVHESGYA